MNESRNLGNFTRAKEKKNNRKWDKKRHFSKKVKNIIFLISWFSNYVFKKSIFKAKDILIIKKIYLRVQKK